MTPSVPMSSVLEIAPRRRTVLALAVALSPLPWLAGCAAAPAAAPQDDAARLLERARAYWAAIKANDRVTAWQYEDVSLDPRWTLQAYLKRGGIVYEAVEVKGVRRLEGDEGEVELEVVFSVPQVRLRGQRAVSADRWRRIDGRWYHELGRNSLFEERR